MVFLITPQPVTQLLVGISLIACGKRRHDENSIDQLVAPAILEAGSVKLRRGEQHSGREGPSRSRRTRVKTVDIGILISGGYGIATAT